MQSFHHNAIPDQCQFLIFRSSTFSFSKSYVFIVLKYARIFLALFFFFIKRRSYIFEVGTFGRVSFSTTTKNELYEITVWNVSWFGWKSGIKNCHWFYRQIFNLLVLADMDLSLCVNWNIFSSFIKIPEVYVFHPIFRN